MCSACYRVELKAWSATYMLERPVPMSVLDEVALEDALDAVALEADEVVLPLVAAPSLLRARKAQRHGAVPLLQGHHCHIQYPSAEMRSA